MFSLAGLGIIFQVYVYNWHRCELSIYGVDVGFWFEFRSLPNLGLHEIGLGKMPRPPPLASISDKWTMSNRNAPSFSFLVSVLTSFRFACLFPSPRSLPPLKARIQESPCTGDEHAPLLTVDAVWLEAGLVSPRDRDVPHCHA